MDCQIFLNFRIFSFVHFMRFDDIRSWIRFKRYECSFQASDTSKRISQNLTRFIERASQIEVLRITSKIHGVQLSPEVHEKFLKSDKKANFGPFLLKITLLKGSLLILENSRRERETSLPPPGLTVFPACWRRER